MLNIFIILTFFFLLTFAYASLQGAPWVPMRRHDIARFLKLADIQQGQNFYDLGCGDGRIVCAAADAAAKATGFEISLLPFLLAKIRCFFNKNNKNTKIHYKNFWKVNLNNADIIYFFLIPKIYPKLSEKLKNELKPGTKIIAYVWPLPDWTPAQIDREPGYPCMYLYQL